MDGCAQLGQLGLRPLELFLVVVLGLPELDEALLLDHLLLLCKHVRVKVVVVT